MDRYIGLDAHTSSCTLAVVGCQRRSKIAHSWRVKMSHFDGR